MGLKRKLIIAMLVVGTLPLLLGALFSYVEGSRSLQSILGSNFQALASQTASQVDFLMTEEIAKNTNAARNPVIVDSVVRQNAFVQNLPEMELKPWVALAKEDWHENGMPPESLFYDTVYLILQVFWKEHIRSLDSIQAIYITDAQGFLVSSINTYPSFIPSVSPALKKEIAQGKTFLSKIYLDKGDRHVFHIAVPVFSGVTVVGAFHRIYSAKKFFGPVLETVRFGNTGHVMMIDAQGKVIDCPILPTGTRLPNAEFVRQVVKLESGWVGINDNGHGSKEFSIIGFSPVSSTNEVNKNSSAFSWHILAWQSSEELFEPARKLVNWSLGIGGAAILLVAFLGTFAANKVVKPIQRLQKAAVHIGKGNLNERVNVESDDEIGKLANSFNQMVADLKSSRQSEQQRMEEFRKFFFTVEQSPTSVLITDTEGHIEYANPTFCKVTGYEFEELLGQKPSILKSGFHPNSFYEKLWETILSGKDWRGEFCNKKKNGEPIWELQSISPLRSLEGNITHFVSIKIDDTERKRAEKKMKIYAMDLEQALKVKGNLITELEGLKKDLEIISITDPLTELFNRRGVEEKLEFAKVLFKRNKKKFSIILSDLDHFKRVNDTYGHDAGDYILVEVAKILKDYSRGQDVPCRWGGEEFLIFLPETDIEGTLILAEKYRALIEEKEFMYDGQKIPVTMSFGLSVFDDADMQIEKCIKNADEHLYQAKNEGRNRVVYNSKNTV